MKTRSTNADHLFCAENIRNCEKYVISIQRNLDKAVASNNTKRIRHIFDLLTKRSFAVKVLAVYRITKRNKGKNTAGVDGLCMPKGDTETSNKIALELLNAIDIKSKPHSIRRVFIPKPNGKKRPLGIPTLRDRITQEIIRMALEPIVEYHSHDNSYGFRPKRSCQDAIAHLFLKLSKRTAGRFIIEGDIKGCFDNISHKHITNTLASWNVPSQMTGLINMMLKSGIFHNGEVFSNETGTPQGGVISPLLANVALTALDNFIENNHSTPGHKERKTNPLVRYADDFVIICKSKTMATEIKESVKDFLKSIGLTMSDEKTHITHTYDGFDFLGFTLRKFKRYKNKPCINPADYVLLIKPQKEKVQNVLSDCIEVLNKNKTVPQDTLIHLLNPKITGWANYYKYVVSSEIFRDVEKILWHSLLRWSKRRHPQKSTSWVIRKYFSQKKQNTLIFREQSKTSQLRVMRELLSKKRFVKVKSGKRVYNVEHAEYWNKREYIKSSQRLFGKRVGKAFEKQDGFCPYCKTQIKENEIVNSEVDMHHMLPQSFGGTDSQSNLRLLHKECHIDLHKRLSREKITEIVKTQRLDYINAKCY